MFSPYSKQEKYLSYQSPLSELSSRELKLGSWYVRHKIAINRLVTFSLFVFGFFTNLFGIVFWGKYVLFDYSSDTAMYRNLVVESINYTAVKADLNPTPLSIQGTDIYDSSPGKYDIATTVSNPNTHHYALITFHHTSDTDTNPLTTTVVLPGKTVPLVNFGVDAINYPSDTRFVIDNIEWKRVNRHRIPDPKSFADQRLQFDITNVAFLQKNTLSGIATNKLTFELTNNSSYSFWQPLFIVSLIDGNTTGLLRLELQQFRSGETRTIDLRSLADNMYASEIELTPIINVFDPQQFISPGE